MRIYIDFDDVLCETGKAFSSIAKELFGIDVPYQEVQFFNLQKSFDLDEDQYSELMRVGHLPEVLLSYEETPGASEMINKWYDEGHEIAVITGRPFDAYAPSRKWLDEHNLKQIPLYCVDKYGRENFNQGATYNMTLEQLYSMSYDFAIEDSPASFEHVLHFEDCTVAVVDRPWNRNSELPNNRFVRCDNWGEIGTLFEKACQKKAEESIRKRFHKQLFTPFAKACKTYELIKEGDHIAVCISGGKDSMLMAKLFQEIKRHRKVNFELTFLVMDPGYNRENRALIESNAKKLGIPVTVFESSIFDAVDTIEKSPCYLCARMRRGYLYSKAKEIGCNKIALGHHYDDVIETILMAMLHGGQIQTMMPKLHSTNFEGMELIRPLYLIREEDICKWRDYNNLHFLQCACHFTETCSTYREDETTSSKRLETKKLIRELKKTNPFIEGNIFKSVENVNLSTIIAYKKEGVKHHFLDEYDR